MTYDRATDAQIETITRDVIAGRAASNSYLQLLVIAVQGALGDERGKRLTLDAIGATHESFYAVVMRTIGEHVSGVERNRRANFARSACSTLRAYVRAGGRVQSVDPLTVSKQSLRAATHPVAVGTPREQSFTRAYERVARLADRLAKESPAQARARLRTAIAGLQAQLVKLTPPIGLKAPARPSRAATPAGRRNRRPMSVAQLRHGAAAH